MMEGLVFAAWKKQAIARERFPRSICVFIVFRTDHKNSEIECLFKYSAMSLLETTRGNGSLNKDEV